MDKDFKFSIPLEFKRSEDGKMRISGIAATEDKDLQGEVIKMQGLDISELQEGRGVFNDDHSKGAENIIGIIDKAVITEDNALFVEGDLLEGNPKAENYFRIMQHCMKNNKPPRVQMSVEGKILERSGSSGKLIKKAKIDKVALTLDPVNRNTFAQLCKSLIEEVPAPHPEHDKSADAVSSSPASASIFDIEKSLNEIKDLVQKAFEFTQANRLTTAPQNLTNADSVAKESIGSKREKAKKVIKTLITKYPKAAKKKIIKSVIKKLL